MNRWIGDFVLNRRGNKEGEPEILYGFNWRITASGITGIKPAVASLSLQRILIILFWRHVHHSIHN